MIETRVRILSASQGTAWVEPAESLGCTSCQSKNSCGISGLGRFFSNRRKPIALACEGATPGGELMVAVAEGELLLAGLFAFLLPAMLAVLGAALAAMMPRSGNLEAVLGAGLGIATGLLLARFFAAAPRLRVRRPDPSLTSGETP